MGPCGLHTKLQDIRKLTIIDMDFPMCVMMIAIQIQKCCNLFPYLPGHALVRKIVPQTHFGSFFFGITPAECSLAFPKRNNRDPIGIPSISQKGNNRNPMGIPRISQANSARG